MNRMVLTVDEQCTDSLPVINTEIHFVFDINLQALFSRFSTAFVLPNV